MKIDYKKFIRACTDVNHMWRTEYSKPFFDDNFDCVTCEKNGYRFKKYWYEKVRRKNYKSFFVFEFKVFTDNTYEIIAPVAYTKNIKKEDCDILIIRYTEWLNRLFQDLVKYDLIIKD